MSRHINVDPRYFKGAKGGCFPGYAKVNTPTGRVPIQDIKVQDKVVCFNHEGQLSEGVVRKVIEHSEDLVLRIFYWGGHLDVTSNHWLLNQYNTFAVASSFTSEDALVNEDGHLCPVIRIQELGRFKVYNLNVSPEATFICEGIRAHNGGRGVGSYRDYIEGSKGGGRKGGGGSTPAPKEAPNTLRSNSVARVIDVISEGPIEGLIDGNKSIFFNGTALQNANGSYNFSGVNIETREGEASQSFIPGFPSVESEVPVGVEVLKGTPIVRTINNSDANAVIVKINIPSLTKQSNNGDLNGHDVQFSIDLQSDGGGFSTVRTETISGKTTSPYEASYRINLPQGGSPWDVRVTRISENSDTDARISNRTVWSTYTIVIDNKLTYDATAVIGVEIDAQQFSEQVPSRAYEIKGLKIKIPSNYDPITKEYTGLWDGSFDIAWTDNPAWVFYDILTNTRYGLGNTIDVDKVDKYALYQIGQYCDELVPDGYGGQEPRYTFNGIINTREEAFKVLNSIASSFRGMIYWSSGLVTAITDQPQDYSRIITPANTIDGIINYSGSSLKIKNSVALVRWNDPEDGFNGALIAVEDPDLIARFGWKPKDVIAYGCTSKGQAYRQGNWLLDTEKNSTEVATFKGGFDIADLVPGEVIAIADPDYAGVRYGGRIASATVDAVTIDKEVTLVTGETYTISCVLPDGSIETKDITNTVDGSSYTVLNLLSSLSEAPQAGSMWVMSGTDAAPRQFRVVYTTEVEKNIYEVSCLFYDPTKYARVEQDIDLESPSYTTLPEGALQAPSNITTQEYLYKTVNTVIEAGLTISWTPPNDPRVKYYQVQMQRPDSTVWEDAATTESTSVDIKAVSPGAYTFRVRALDPFGLRSDWSQSFSDLLGLVAPPSNVSDFKISNIAGYSTLSWTPIPDLDRDYYIIKHQGVTEGAEWGAGTVIKTNIPGASSNADVPTLLGTYMIKAVDTSGVESVAAALIVSHIRDISQDNVIVTITESPDFTGTKINCVIDGSTLVMDSFTSAFMADWGNMEDVQELAVPGVPSESIYKYSTGLDLGQVYTSRVVPFITAQGIDLTDVMEGWNPLSSVLALSEAQPSQWEAITQLRTTDDDPEASPTWGEWIDLIIGDYTCRAYEFQLRMISNNNVTTPSISELGVIIDMPDRVERGHDVDTGGTGVYDVVFSSSFKEVPSIQVAGQGMLTGDTINVSNQSVSGFRVTVLDNTASAIQRTFDWVASGYGRQQ